MQQTKSAQIKWAPFSKKHCQYITNALKVRMSVAEGAVRSGKTIDHCIIAAAYLDETEDTYHLATGSTVGNAKLNIGVCNGYGLEALFRGRCKWGKFKSNEALYITDTKGREKVVIFAGGAKSDSYKSILGNSYGLWLATEINEHFDSDDSRTSFLKVAMARQIAAKWPLRLWDLNPNNPGHKIYTDYIDKWRDNPPVGGYQYELFTLHDNRSLSKQRIREIESQYSVGSVWYRRDILGQRVRAEGLIYQAFADKPEVYKIKGTDADYDYINIGVDIGGNKSFHTFVASGLKYDYSKLTALASKRVKATGTTSQSIVAEFGKFVEFVTGKYGHVSTVYFESAEQILKNDTINAYPHMTIRNSIKYEILVRVRKGTSLMNHPSHKFYYTEDAQTVADALCGAVYDPKEAEKGIDKRLDDGTSDVDTLDAWEYSWEEQIKRTGGL